MSVIVTIIIIITHEACFPLLFLIGGEDGAIPSFYSEEIFFCFFLCIWKGKTSNKHKQITPPPPPHTHMKHAIELERSCKISTSGEPEREARVLWSVGLCRSFFWFTFPLLLLFFFLIMIR